MTILIKERLSSDLPSRSRKRKDATRRWKRFLNASGREFRACPPVTECTRIDLDAMKSRALGLDSSYLFIQGPPGAGKTWAGARVIAHLLKNGKRVGVAAQSHKAIHNLLNEIEKFARETGLSFRGLKKSTDNADSVYEGDFIKSEPQVAAHCRGGGSRSAHRRHCLALLAV